MAFKSPTSNPTRECLPLVIQLMPYYAQYNELVILRELHSKLGDPEKQLHHQMLMDAIVREQMAIRSGCKQKLPKAGGNGLWHSHQNGFLQRSNSSFLGQQLAVESVVAASSDKQSNGSSGIVVGEEPTTMPMTMMMPFWDAGKTMGGLVGGIGVGGMEMGGGSEGSSENDGGGGGGGGGREDEDVVIVDEEEERDGSSSGGGGTHEFGGSGNHCGGARGGMMTMGMGTMTATNVAIGSRTMNEFAMGQPAQAILQQQNDPLAKRRADFLREASTLYNNKYRMLSRSVYEFYIKRLKITQNLDPRLLLKKDLEIRNKFELAIFAENGVPMERLVERGKEHRKLVAIEEVFDVVHAFHERIGHGKRMAIYDAIKREYANITLNCVLLYMAGCQGCYSTGGEPTPMDGGRRSAQQQMMGGGGGVDDMQQQMKSNRCSPREKTVESRAAKLGLDEIDYSEHFVIGEDEIRCRHCHFVYFHKSRQRPRHSLRSHLRNYHRKLFNQMMDHSSSGGGGGGGGGIQQFGME